MVRALDLRVRLPPVTGPASDVGTGELGSEELGTEGLGTEGLGTEGLGTGLGIEGRCLNPSAI